MKLFRRLTAGLLLLVVANASVRGATTIVSDNYTVTTSGTGFGLNAGVNTGINPPTTRLTGTAAANLRYLQTVTTRPAATYDINNNRVRITGDNSIGRFTLSANGSTPFDFGPALGTSDATPANPISYDVKISMRNDATGSARFSLGLATVEGDINNMDFAVQMYRVNTGDNFYTLQKRIDRGSFNGTTSTDGTGDINAVMTTTGVGTNNILVDVLIHVTDAGTESGANYNSRIQVSLNNGSTWIYDTSTDASLSNHFRFDAAGRYFAFDQAPNTTGTVYYDAFSVTWNSGPRTWNGAGANGNWNNATNWGGAIPANGSALTFNGTTRPTNTNDLSNLLVPSLKFNNGGFSLYGNAFTNSGAVTNLSGVNTFNGDMGWSSTAAKTWSIASGSEVVLNNTNAIEVTGDHSIVGGGTLRLKKTINIGQATTANPAFVINEGSQIVDGGTFRSRGDYRIGSQATGAGAQTVLTNGALLNLTVAGANLRVGDSANPVTSRLDINNSTLTLAGGSIGLPYAASAIGAVSQSGGTVSGAVLNFNQAGAGTGTYTVTSGTLETLQIKKTTAGGQSQIYFDNAVLRPAVGAINPFFSGLDLAQIQPGGLTLDATADVVIDQAISGAGALIKNNSASVSLNGGNTFSGGTILNAGQLSLGNDAALGSGFITINSGVLAGVGGTRVMANSTVVGGNFAIGGANALTLSGTVDLGSSTRLVTVTNSSTTTFSGAVVGAGGFTKDGTGLLQFSGGSANTYSGNTVVNAGILSLAKSAGVNSVAGNVTIGDGLGGTGADVLRLNNANQIPDAAMVTISASGLFDLNGFSESVATVSSASASSQVTLGAGTLTVGDAGNSTFAGIISGSGSLVKQGSGTLTLSSASTYSGSTTINVGKLALSSGASIASSTNYALSSGATLDVSAVTFSVASGATLACKSSSGNADVTGNVTLSSGAQFSTQISGTSSTSGKLAIAGNLTVNANTVKVNVTGGPLDVGTYVVISFTGSRTGSFNSVPTITGSGLGAGLAAKIVQSSGLISLNVYNPSAANTIFKVMHYNIHFGTDANGVVDTTDTANFILNQNVDLVSLNEVARNMPRSNGRDLIAELSAKTGMAYVFSNNDTSLPGDDEFGNAILSKYPILFRDHKFLPRLGSNEQRGLLKTIIDVKGKFVSFWSTHLDFHADDTERLMAVTNLNTWVDQEVFPTIITGDFNETPDKTTHARMELKWDDIWLDSGDGTLGRTSPCPGPTQARIDYIWKQHGAPLISTNTVVNYTIEESDHFPVLSKFILTITTNHASGFYLRFDEGSGTNVTDSVGGLKGILDAGAPTWNTNTPSGKVGDYSLWFNGNKKLTVPDTKQIIGTNGVNDNYTLQTWVKIAVNYAPPQRAILFQYDRRPGFSFSINTNRTLHTTTFKIQDISSTATIPNDGLWHHVAVVHTDGVNMKFYIDGTLASTVAYTGGSGYRTSSAITVGSADDDANPFTGFLSRVKFDSRALTAAQLDYPAVPPVQRSAPPSTEMDLATWQTLHGITDAEGDDDGDGQRNSAEFVAGTNPNDSNSALRMIAAKAEGDHSVVSWTSVGGKRYRLQSTDDLSKPFIDVVRDAANEIDSAPQGMEGIQSFTDTQAATNTTRYYRIKIVSQ
ncbi:MAG: autotransporter-associated beta strand repeat protein [Verrucomicrobiales bacterium]|nr:autotransporter-associated beta strand repeat protein [Verrucomicrobiales bacterium]